MKNTIKNYLTGFFNELAAVLTAAAIGAEIAALL